MQHFSWLNEKGRSNCYINNLLFSVFFISEFEDKYHLEEQHRSRKVGVLFEVFDHGCLNNLTPALHYQAGGGHRGQLEVLHVPQTPSQNLR